jgi:Arylsulfotransferase (ASST)
MPGIVAVLPAVGLENATHDVACPFLTVHHRVHRYFFGALAAIVTVAVPWTAAPAPAAGADPIAVYPFPGSKYTMPGTQIAFRGLSASSIGAISVVGSSSGAHAGRIVADSDGQGASFIPSKPFTAGETVTVATHLAIAGAPNGTFSFSVCTPAPQLAPAPIPTVAAGARGLQHFRSRPDLEPAAVTVSKASAPASQGDILVAPQFGPTQDGPMILDPDGKLVWFDANPLSQKEIITDFRVQNLHGQPVLTWFQGNTSSGSGRGEGIIFNSKYEEIATVHAANGLDVDLHEFEITPQGDAYLLAIAPVKLPGVRRPVIDAEVQEIDISTGLVLFDWHALDHIPLSESSKWKGNQPGHILDPYHLNSVSLDHDGNLLISARNTSAVYNVNRVTGQIMWRLGGTRSSFKMGSGASFAYQHDAVMQPNGTITLFDDGGAPPKVHKYSRGLRLSLNMKKMTASLVRAYNHPPPLAAAFEGGEQALSRGDTFVGWGQQPYFTEFNSSGQETFDAHFTAPSGSYRAYRFPWSGQPARPPALAGSPASDGSLNLWASWNGATTVSSWRVLAGSTPSTLRNIGTAPRRGFETTITAHNANPYFAVQALGSKGQLLSTSNTVMLPAHLAIYGQSAFVPSNGLAGLPVGCFRTTPCQLVTTVKQGNTVLARSGKENVGANQNGIVYFRLSPSARRTLSRARSHRIGVSVTVQDVSGTSASTSMTLVPFSASGAGPHRSVTQSKALAIFGETDFVSSSGYGGTLAECISDDPCHVRATVTVGKATAAHTGSEFIGAHELGYVNFSVSKQGQSLLAHASGHQLGAHIMLTGGGATASADVALIPFR